VTIRIVWVLCTSMGRRTSLFIYWFLIDQAGGGADLHPNRVIDHLYRSQSSYMLFQREDVPLTNQGEIVR
jgi:hypothetical protein